MKTLLRWYRAYRCRFAHRTLHSVSMRSGDDHLFIMRCSDCGAVWEQTTRDYYKGLSQ